MARRDNQVCVGFQFEFERFFKLDHATAKEVWIVRTRIAVRGVDPSIDDHKQTIDIKPVRALYADFQCHFSGKGFQVLTRNTQFGFAGFLCGHFQVRAVRHHQSTLFRSPNHLDRIDFFRVIGGRLNPISQPARTMIVVVRVGIHNAVNSKPLVEELQPIKQGVGGFLAVRLDDRVESQHAVQRVDLDHVDEWKGPFKPVVGLTVAIFIVKHPAHFRVINLNQFLAAVIVQGESLDLRLEIRAGDRSTAVLRSWRQLHGKRILMVQRQRRSGELHSGNGCQL